MTITKNRIGLGCMGMSEFYGPKNDKESLSVIAHAVENGVNMLDTADLYGDGHNERLIGKFLKNSTLTPTIATKCGIVRESEILKNGNFKRSINGTKNYIKSSCESSLKRLGLEAIDIFYLHRIDPNTPIEESIEALRELINEGKIRKIGLSEVSSSELIRANKVHQISYLQSEYSLWTRDVEDEILPTCKDLNVKFVSFSPLGRGLVTPNIKLDDSDFRNQISRFNKSNIVKNHDLFGAIKKVSNKYEISNAQVCLTWLLSQDYDITPIPGTRRLKYLKDNLSSVDITMDESDLLYLSHMFTKKNISGHKYLDSSNA